MCGWPYSTAPPPDSVGGGRTGDAAVTFRRMLNHLGNTCFLVCHGAYTVLCPRTQLMPLCTMWRVATPNFSVPVLHLPGTTNLPGTTHLPGTTCLSGTTPAWYYTYPAVSHFQQFPELKILHLNCCFLPLHGGSHFIQSSSIFVYTGL